MKATAKYYKTHPEARAKKKAYDTAYHSTPARIRYRSELNKANRKRGTYGHSRGKDLSHTKEGGLVKEKASINRARQGANKKSTKK